MDHGVGESDATLVGFLLEGTGSSARDGRGLEGGGASAPEDLDSRAWAPTAEGKGHSGEKESGWSQGSKD